MSIQKGIFCGIAALLLAGLTTVRYDGGGLREVGDDEANGLVGGAPACISYIPTICGTPKATSGCPANQCQIASSGGGLARVATTVWCGLYSTCSGGSSMSYGGYDFGCGSSG